MKTYNLDFINPTIRSFVYNQKHGAILFNIFPYSDIVAYHSLEPPTNVSHQLFIIGNADDLMILNDRLSRKLLTHEHRNGFWSGVILEKAWIRLSYNYKSILTQADVLKLLSIELRHDLAQVCKLAIADL